MNGRNHSRKSALAKLLTAASCSAFLVGATDANAADAPAAPPQTQATPQVTSANSASALFKQGLAHMEAGNFPEACPMLAESLQLALMPGTLFTLAFCESKWERLATAETRLTEYLHLFNGLSPAQQATQQKFNRVRLAEEELKRIKPLIPMLTITLAPNAPNTTVVMRNGQVFEQSLLGKPVAVDPGTHKLSAQIPGGKVYETHVMISPGASKSILLEPEIPPPPEPKVAEPAKPPIPPPSPAPQSTLKPAKATVSEFKPPFIQTDESPSRLPAWIAGGIGLAGIGTSLILGGIVKKKESTANDHCGPAVGQTNPARCDDIGTEAGQGIQPMATASNISLILGGIGIGVSAGLLFFDSSSQDKRTDKVKTESNQAVLSVQPLGSKGLWLGVSKHF